MMIFFVYELKYVDKRKLVPVTECSKTRTIATAVNSLLTKVVTTSTS